MNQVKPLCEIFREEIIVPVFEHNLPDGYKKTCIVVSEQSHNFMHDEGEYHINIYAPNITRVVDGQDDFSCPDRETINNLFLQVRHVMQGLWNSDYDLNLVSAQLIREHDMHYLNIALMCQY